MKTYVRLRKRLKDYVEALNHFFSLRQRTESDPLRREAVKRLRELRHDDSLGVSDKDAGLQSLMRRYLIRNTKQKNERRYFLVNKRNGKYESRQFEKIEDLRDILKECPLLPFDGAHALFYLELRELIEQTCEQARERYRYPYIHFH